MLDASHCRVRQRRLLERVQQRKLDAVVCGGAANVYYLTGHWTWWQHHSAVILFDDGRAWLITANEPARGAAADETAAYSAQWNSTLRQEQPSVVGALVHDQLIRRRAGRVALDASPVSALVAKTFGTCHTIDADLWQMRRVKDADELELMRMAIRCAEAMYRRAREIVEPGVPELEVYAKLHEAAVMAAGEPLSAYLGNDYACGAAGGAARRDRRAQAGELYILDVGPAYRGYFADVSRALAVNRRPTEAQQRAWESVAGALRIVEGLAGPGVRCRELVAAVDEHFKRARGAGLSHHLGHGVGLQPHEYPHLNAKWDDVLLEGEVFTAEPGQYGPELNAGIRLENQYLVTRTGVVNLVDVPLELV
jgi:Xaa-Pro aminopeptidase